MTTQPHDSIYDRLRKHLTARDIISRLGLDLVRESGSEACCRPLCHESSSGESLHINLHTGRWLCRACRSSGRYGDLIQLVEYVQGGGCAPSHGKEQGSSESHRAALRWLCEQYAVPFDDGARYSDPALDIVHMLSMMAHEYLLSDSPDAEAVRAWIAEKWGFDRAHIEGYGIGFIPSPVMPALLNEASRIDARDAFRKSGVGYYDSATGDFVTRFEGRVTFPYLEHGRAVYLIGRLTKWTPERGDSKRAAKYYKLPVHSEKRPYISALIRNDHIYNEAILSDGEISGSSVIVGEGVADGVALSSIGAPVVSPITISFSKTDLVRFVAKLKAKNIPRIEILFDNELSGSGEYASMRQGAQFVEHGIAVSIITLPLPAKHRAARDEVMRALGDETFARLLAADPQERKRIIAEAVVDDGRRAWLAQQFEAAKVDGAEWVAAEGANAAAALEVVRRDAKDYIEVEVDRARAALLARHGSPESIGEINVVDRLRAFDEAISLAAHIDERLIREGYASVIARAAGKGVSKATVSQKIASIRKTVVAPKRGKQEAEQKEEASIEGLVLLPPDHISAPASVSAPRPSAPPPPNAPPAAPASPGKKPAPAAPPPPTANAVPLSEHDRYAKVRESVIRAVDDKLAEEFIGKHVAQTITFSMGFTPFRTPDDLYLVRGNDRIAVGLDHQSPDFLTLIYMASALTPKKASHRAYIAAAMYHLELDARRVPDVSWSYVASDRSVYFPTGDKIGSIIRIGSKDSPNGVERMRMSDVKIPSVAGRHFRPFTYTDQIGGISEALNVFRWTSLSDGNRLLLVYWIACLPILRRVGTAPIVRIEGGSSSGKTRTVDAVSWLVNGGKSSSVPTAAALISRLSSEMLTIDDNRESSDMNAAFRGTLLQATSLGAREKRKGNSDTGTVVERVCGALLMNGIEPIHDGKSELASRMLTMRAEKEHRLPESPVADDRLMRAILDIRDRFLSESCRRCADALRLDEQHGEFIGEQIEGIFGKTRIGRLSAYLRVMYLAWVAGLPEVDRVEALENIAPIWRAAFDSISGSTLNSLVREEFSVAAVSYAIAWGERCAERAFDGADEKVAFDGKFRMSISHGDCVLGPLSAPQLARIIRNAGKEMNAPRTVSADLRAGQLEARILDGIDFLESSGINVDVDVTQSGKRRFTFYVAGSDRGSAPQSPSESGSTINLGDRGGIVDSGLFDSPPDPAAGDPEGGQDGRSRAAGPG